LNLSNLPGVEECKVSYSRGKATLVYAAGVEPDVQAVKAAVSRLGYSPGEATVRDTN
jgi:hypothetical protein